MLGKANMAVTDEAVWAVAKNAARHLVEANQHYSGKRFASAVASAVYAVEETGKLSFLVTGGESPKKKRHVAHTILFVAFARIIGNWNWTREWAGILRSGLAPDVVLTEQQQCTMAEHPDRSSTIPTSATWKIGALGFLLMATINGLPLSPARCWNDPLMPHAMRSEEHT